MKIRKILPLALLAIGSVFMLSSCDALLDAIFANNTVNVSVAAYIPTNGYFPGTDYVTVDIIGPTSVSTTVGYSGSDFYYMYWDVTIPKLSDGTYTVQATYHHPVSKVGGTLPGNYIQSAVIYLPAHSGNPHNVNVVFPSF
jgi:hypothetical protein